MLMGRPMPLASLTSHLTDAIAHHGVAIVFLVMAVDAVLPAGGELVMLYAGALASGALAAAGERVRPAPASRASRPSSSWRSPGRSATSPARSAAGLGARGGRPLLERHGRWLHLGPARVERAERWFDRFGDRAVFFGRLTPLVRSFISIPAGVLGSPLGRYTALTFAGSAHLVLRLRGRGLGAGHELRQRPPRAAVPRRARRCRRRGPRRGRRDPPAPRAGPDVSVSVGHGDTQLAEHANRLAQHHDALEDVALRYAAVSEGLFLAGVALLVVAGLLLGRRQLVAAGVLSAIAAGVALAIGAVISMAVDRARPFVAHPAQVHLFSHHAADAGFPSDHATAAFAIAGVLVGLLGRRALPVLLAAVLLAAARVLLGLHYPGDVLAGAALGLLVAIVVVRVARHPRAAAAVATTPARTSPSTAG